MSAVANDNFFAENWKYLLAALALHAAIAVALTVTMKTSRQTVIPGQSAIKAVIVDNTAQRQQREKDKIEAERLAREQAEAGQRAREQAETERKREQEEQLEAKRQADERERQRVAAEQKRQADEKQAAAVRKQAEEKRAAEIKAKQVEKQNAEREAREQTQREAELKRQLAEEEGRMQVENSSLLGQYVALIQQRVVRNWNKPGSARPCIQCEVKVTQLPGGTVASVQIDKCNGDAAVRQSIEAAVYRSSPLPAPPDARLFQRVIVFVFKPTE
jgi:colicin import membrane protein